MIVADFTKYLTEPKLETCDLAWSQTLVTKIRTLPNKVFTYLRLRYSLYCRAGNVFSQPVQLQQKHTNNHTTVYS